MSPSPSSTRDVDLSITSRDVAVGTPLFDGNPCILTTEPTPMHDMLPPPVQMFCRSYTGVAALVAAVNVPRSVDSNGILLDEMAETCPVKSSRCAKFPLGTFVATVVVAVIPPV